MKKLERFLFIPSSPRPLGSGPRINPRSLSRSLYILTRTSEFANLVLARFFCHRRACEFRCRDLNLDVVRLRFISSPISIRSSPSFSFLFRADEESIQMGNLRLIHLDDGIHLGDLMPPDNVSPSHRSPPSAFFLFIFCFFSSYESLWIFRRTLNLESLKSEMTNDIVSLLV